MNLNNINSNSSSIKINLISEKNSHSDKKVKNENDEMNYTDLGILYKKYLNKEMTYNQIKV